MEVLLDMYQEHVSQFSINSEKNFKISWCMIIVKYVYEEHLFRFMRWKIQFSSHNNIEMNPL